MYSSDRDGGIAVDPVDLSLSGSADRAEEAAPGEGADAVLWESMTVLTGEESTLTATYLAFLAAAGPAAWGPAAMWRGFASPASP